MDKGNTKVQLSEEEKAQAFVTEYGQLCDKHGYQIVTQPTFVARDDGTFSVKLISSVGKLPKESN